MATPESPMLVAKPMKVQNSFCSIWALQLIILLMASFVSVQSVGQTTHILFEKNSDIVSPFYKSKLDAIIFDIKNGNGKEEIGLSGHTDDDASEDYNKSLSLNRAVAVRTYLLVNGLNNQIHIDSKGESQPLFGNETENDKAKNRRVEILRNYSKRNFAFDIFDKEFQVYTVNNTKDTLLKCKWGTQIQINKGIFQTEGDVTSVTIKVQEFYKKGDFVLSNLTTQDINNNQLESRGMINIEAFQKDKELNLKPGQEIGIVFKDRKMNDSTKVFYGITHGEEISWDNSDDSTTRIRTEGTTFTKQGTSVIIQSHYRFETINGELFKIVKTEKDGKMTYDTIPAESEKLTRDVMLRSMKLGWVNCDKFFRDPSPKVDLIVKYTGDFVPTIVLVFEDINSVLPYNHRVDNTIIFKNIPSGKKISFIGLFKSGKSDKILFAQKRTTSENGLVETLTFDEIRKEDLEKKISAL